MENAVTELDLKQFTGSEEYYAHQVTPNYYLSLTEGCHYVRQQCKAFWLFDLILSYQHLKAFKDEYFQVWDLKKLEDSSWIINCTNGNTKTLAKQKLEFSDFPLSKITIWVVDKVAMLPSEY